MVVEKCSVKNGNFLFWRSLYSAPETSPDPLLQPLLRTPAGDLGLGTGYVERLVT